MIGTAWGNQVTYWYRANPNGSQLSFGAWHSGRTPAVPLPPTLSFGGTDVAEYYQRLTTVPATNVTPVGIGCAGSTMVAPRLVISTLPAIGTTPVLDIADAAPSTQALLAIGVGPTLATPLPILGCSVWLSNAALNVPVPVPTTGVVTFPLPIPNDPGLVGLPLSSQGVVATSPNPGFTNALELRLQ